MTTVPLSQRTHFNPRPHTEGDNQTKINKRIHINFNPRPHTEGDIKEYLKSCSWGISIHALTRRATHGCKSDGGAEENFNPRPHTEGDKSLDQVQVLFNNFNPRPHTEGDVYLPASKLLLLLFQSTPSHGGRPYAAPFVRA